MLRKYIVIYCRYSSDMQRPDRCADQEREVRAGLAKLDDTAAAIAAGHFAEQFARLKTEEHERGPAPATSP